MQTYFNTYNFLKHPINNMQLLAQVHTQYLVMYMHMNILYTKKKKCIMINLYTNQFIQYLQNVTHN